MTTQPATDRRANLRALSEHLGATPAAELPDERHARARYTRRETQPTITAADRAAREYTPSRAQVPAHPGPPHRAVPRLRRAVRRHVPRRHAPVRPVGRPPLPHPRRDDRTRHVDRRTRRMASEGRPETGRNNPHQPP